MSRAIVSRPAMVQTFPRARRRGWSFALWGASALVAAGCGSASPPPPEHAVSEPAAAAPASPPMEEPPVCVDDKDQRVQCLSDADCCPRFVCGKDPELSQALSYCIFGG